MLIALAFLREHWRAVAAVVLLAAAFFAGRASVPDVPARVDVQTRIEYRDRVVEVEKRVEVKAEQQTRVVYRDRLIEKDGTTREREVERTEAASQSTATTDHTVERVVTRDVEKRVVVEAPRPAWRVSVLAGIDARQVRLLPPDAGAPLVGASVEHRIVGGLSAGVWALHRFDAGAPLPVVGLSLSYEF